MDQSDTINRCKKCILPKSLPSVKLNDKGVCNHCKNYDELMANWDTEKKRRELIEIFDWAKKQKRSYDCLITLSGGKDSTYALYVCDKVYKLKCLCVTFDNGFMSHHAKENIKNAIESTNADHIFYTINRDLLLKLYKLFLEKCGDFCSVCMQGIDRCPEIVRSQLNIPLLVTGHGKRISYLGAFPEVFQGSDAQFFNEVVKGEFIENSAQQLIPSKSILNSVGKLYSKLGGKTSSVLKQFGIKFECNKPTIRIHLYDYLLTSRKEIYQTIKKEMNWKSPEDEAEHTDCLLHELQWYINSLKFPETTPLTFFHSGLIRQKLMSRSDAITIEREKLHNPQMPEILSEFLKEIGMSNEEFELYVKDWKRINKFRRKK